MGSKQATEKSPDLVNYMPGMPRLTAEPGLVGRVVRSLFHRRGGLRPVVSDTRNAPGRRDGR